jgi:alcohol dehydrogenase
VKAFSISRYGKKERGRIVDMEDPALRDNDVLVQVYAAGVNLLDSKIRNGEFNFSCLIAFRSFWAMM